MDYEKKEKILSVTILLVFLCAIVLHYLLSPWGFYRATADAEANARRNLVETAQQWLGINEADGSHRSVLDIYNAQETLPLGYVVQDTDSWCAAFVSAATAINAIGITAYAFPSMPNATKFCKDTFPVVYAR